MDLFLADFFSIHDTQAFYLAELTDEAQDFFGVSDDDAALQCERSHGQTGPETTRLEQFTHWGCVHLLDRKLIKRSAPNEYRCTRDYNYRLAEALAFMVHARKIGFSVTEAKAMIGDRWPKETLDKASVEAYA
jgi:hypothetical protein